MTTSQISDNDENKRTLSTDPAEYTPTDHFLNRLGRIGPASGTRRNPRITDDVIDACIREGRELPGHKAGRTILEAHVEGRRWWLIVGSKTLAAITAYASDHHQVAAGDLPAGMSVNEEKNGEEVEAL